MWVVIYICVQYYILYRVFLFVGPIEKSSRCRLIVREREGERERKIINKNNDVAETKVHLSKEATLLKSVSLLLVRK